jgi:uncharacterized Zn-finger protein
MRFHNNRIEKRGFNRLSKGQKLRLIMAVVACGLAFYAFGIATNLFASPLFSMFFIISYNTAHEIATYLAAGAIALGVIALTVTLVRKRKVELRQIHNKPVIRMMRKPDEASASVRMTTNTLKMTSDLENNRVEQENQQAIQSVIRPTKQSTVQTASQPYIVKNTATNQEVGIKENRGRLTCPACKKEFSTPLLTLEYVASTPKLIRHCPYCDHPID